MKRSGRKSATSSRRKPGSKPSEVSAQGSDSLRDVQARLDSLSLPTLGRELASITERMRLAAEDWQNAAEGDDDAVFSSGLDLVFANYEMWELGQDLRFVIAKQVAAPHEGINTRALVTSALFSRDSHAHLRAWLQVRPGAWAMKIEAIAAMLEELTGIPFDLIREYFGDELFELAYYLRQLAEARRTHGRGSPEAQAAERRVRAILRRIYNRLFSTHFRRWLIRRLGRERALRLLERLASRLVPILGWLYFALLFIGLLVIWWEIILDP